MNASSQNAEVIVLVGVVLALQALAIVGLLIQRAWRRRAEEALRESERRFRTMADSAPVMIWVSDMDMNITFVNQVWRDFTGYRLHRPLSEPWQDFIHPADLQRCVDYSRDKFALRESFTLECRLRRHDGQYSWVLSTAIPRLTPGGDCLGYIGTCIDVSDRRQADAEKWHHLAQLSHLNRISTMGEFAASMAHELTQPLSAIHNNAEAAARMLAGPSPDLGALREIIQDVRADDRRASDIIHSMRRFLQRRELVVQPLDLDAAVAEVIRLVSVEATVRHMPLRLEAGEQGKLVTGDRVHLQQVVMNLILNAMEALASVPESERVIVVATRLVEPGYATISVSDSGKGIPEGQLDSIFRPFYTTKNDGIGMGLAIIRTIVEAHQGRVWAEHNSPHGAIVQFTVPLCEVAMDAASDTPAPSFASTADRPSLQSVQHESWK